MILDAQLLFSESQAVTASAASTNIYDASAARNIGVGEDMYVLCICTVAMTDGSSDSTVTVTLETDDNAAFSSPALAVQTVGVFAALSAVGTKFVRRLSTTGLTERYIRGYYTVANGNLTTGSFTLTLVKDADLYTAYPDAITITG